MSNKSMKTVASRVRDILQKLGIQHSVGTSWNSAGDPVVVVEIPPGVDRAPVANRLSQEVGTGVVVRQVSRSIVAH
jgi:hypothetical protein